MPGCRAARRAGSCTTTGRGGGNVPALQGFIGEAYPSSSYLERAELRNWYLEQNGSTGAWSLVPTPGVSLLTSVTPATYRAGLEQNGRAFVVVGAGFYEVTTDGATWSTTLRGTLATDANPAT